MKVGNPPAAKAKAKAASSKFAGSEAAEVKVENGVIAIKEEGDEVGEVAPKPKKRRKVVKAEKPDSAMPAGKVSLSFWTGK